jgi:hypothetical protein
VNVHFSAANVRTCKKRSNWQASFTSTMLLLNRNTLALISKHRPWEMKMASDGWMDCGLGTKCRGAAGKQSVVRKVRGYEALPDARSKHKLHATFTHTQLGP